MMLYNGNVPWKRLADAHRSVTPWHFGGLIGLSISGGAALLVGLGGGLTAGTTFAVYAIPLCSLIGGAIVYASAAAAGILMLLSALATLLVFGFNFITISPIIAAALGGILALVAYKQIDQRAQSMPLEVSATNLTSVRRGAENLTIGERVKHVALGEGCGGKRYEREHWRFFRRI